MKILFPDKVIGKRIYLKKNVLADAQEMFLCVDSDRERLRTFLPWVDKTNTLEDEFRFINSSDVWNGKPMTSYGIFYKDKYVGNITVHNIVYDDKRCELGYWLHGDYEGIGLMSEAVSILEGVLLSSGFKRVEIHCSEQNIRSIKVAERNGYRFEGKIKDQLPEAEHLMDMMLFVKHITGLVS